MSAPMRVVSPAAHATSGDGEAAAGTAPTSYPVILGAWKMTLASLEAFLGLLRAAQMRQTPKPGPLYVWSLGPIR